MASEGPFPLPVAASMRAQPPTHPWMGFLDPWVQRCRSLIRRPGFVTWWPCSSLRYCKVDTNFLDAFADEKNENKEFAVTDFLPRTTSLEAIQLKHSILSSRSGRDNKDLLCILA